MYTVLVFKCPVCLEKCCFQIQNNELKPYLNAAIKHNEILVCSTCEVEIARFKVME
jgi:hypothetical protein